MSFLSSGEGRYKLIAVVSLIACFFLSQGKTIIVPDDTKYVLIACTLLLIWYFSRKSLKYPATVAGARNLLNDYLHSEYGPGPAAANQRFEDSQIYPVGVGVGSIMLGEYKICDDFGAAFRRVAIMVSTEKDGLVLRGDVAFSNWQQLVKQIEGSDAFKGSLANQNVLARAGSKLMEDIGLTDNISEKTKE